MRRKPQQIVVDGTPMIAVSTKEFESLLATRRQLGSQTAKSRVLRDTLIDMAEFLDTLVEELAGEALTEPPKTPSPSGSPHPRQALVAEIRQRVHHVRAITGGGRAGHATRPSETELRQPALIPGHRESNPNVLNS
ncbi:hypothetical protein HLK59_17060 [Streptomyces sp. S3(2020)]|uniref:hypothetical protein n=1 Tax=Streptomyces sp. S3(2020) TaxID=2732044 RepID=UPI001487D991|nr:hypothetical protein [Streptomyces sp. S3(2020)]NNN32042.1 hypothetical protein [Streptomyces sp. S3(2020)]